MVASSLSAYADSHDSALAGLEALVNDTAGSGLSDKVSQLFTSFNALAANPNDPTTRATVLTRADAFASGLRDTTSQIAVQRDDMFSQARDLATSVNDIAGRIAKLNTQISDAEAAGADASDMKDQRGKLVSDLAQNVDVHSFQDGAGKFVVRAGGTTLVEGNLAATMSVQLDVSGKLQILTQRGPGQSTDVTSQISGGKLYGIQQARDVDAVSFQTKLDQLAFDIGTAVNTQHAAGFGLDGVSGRNLFFVSPMPGSAATIALDPAMVGQPDRVAASDTAANVPGGSNNAAALSMISGKRVASGATRTPIEAYSDLVGDVGARKQSAQNDVALRGAQAAQTKSLRDSTSGVSLDEEMVSLTRYQRGYEAAAKLIKTVDELLASLMQTL